MCGIAGIHTFGKRTPIQSLGNQFRAIESRGGHACGFAWKRANEARPSRWAAPVKATSKRAQKSLKDFVGSHSNQWVMMHTRFATQGSVKVNENNHPVVRDEIVLTHNGCIYDDWDVFDHFGVDRYYQVDTEALIVALRYGGVEWMAENVQGSFSIAWVDCTKSTEEVNLFTNGLNPLVIGRTKSGHVVWASALKNLKGYDLESHFNASPFKHYRICADGMIRSEWVSDERCEPTVAGVWKGASSGALAPQTPKTSKKASKGPSTPSHGDISAGWVFDSTIGKTGGWRKASEDEMQAALLSDWFDEDGSLKNPYGGFVQAGVN